MLTRSGFLHVENIFVRQRRHRALQPAAIERVIWIGSKATVYSTVLILGLLLNFGQFDKLIA
jgi:hypothetical protein